MRGGGRRGREGKWKEEVMSTGGGGDMGVWKGEEVVGHGWRWIWR